MESNEKTNIEKYIEVLKKDNRSEFQKELQPEDTIVEPTKIDAQLDKLHPILPEKISFKTNLSNKIAITLFLGLITILTPIFSMNFIPFFVLGILSTIVLVKIWILDKSNRITLDKTGIYFNDEFYKWNEIKSTFTCFTEKYGNSENNEFYLLIEFENGKITNLDIEKISFSTFWKYSNFSDDAIIGHYIELYKQNSHQ
ncbi:MAG: hypothetical protein EBQ94_07720 [Flavobacteriales bacterium]|nr:hypothetical protein [Crocinitomicaceae bacterium]NBX80250.1 hypothetical protein [Flavobacteriales bacterium]NCA20269.1 hypothetical protein [Crocinitomicaceae bacterium]